MTDEASLALAATRRLPADALAGLREAFAAEVAERLPRLRDAVTTGDAAALDAALRDAHSLGSSAVIVGEAEVSRAARAAEALLLDRQAGASDVLPALRDRVAELDRLLAGWTP